MAQFLASWHDTGTKRGILDYLARITEEGSPDFVPPEARVAVYDNDGTLWCEKPMLIQLDHILRRLGTRAAGDPSLQDQQPWKAILEKDYAWLSNAVVKYYGGDVTDAGLVMSALESTFGGMVIDEAMQAAASFMAEVQHPTLGRLYHACTYLPMIELLRCMEAHGFTNYIVSGGGQEFVRTISTALYGVPPERVIGSTFELSYQEDDHGGTLLYVPKLASMDDGPEKPVRIWSRIGRRPVVAAGNSNGDIPMLNFAGGGEYPALRLLLLHDDATREFDYVAGAEKSLEVANAQNWTVISMRKDWKQVFADI